VERGDLVGAREALRAATALASHSPRRAPTIEELPEVET
jgi:hypothetical protein